VDPGNEERRIDADLRGVTPGYFRAIGVRLIAGRLFDANDRASTEPVAIVDRTFARSLQANGQVLGRSIRWIRQPAADVQIVGIVDGVRHRSVSDAPRETVYRPHTQYSRPSMYMVVRGGGDERALRQTLAAAVAAVDPRQPLADVATLKERVSRATARARTTLLLAAILAALGLLLAGVGLYGVLSFAVSQRLREFGVRLSMGATPMTLAVGVAREGLALAGAGVAIGSLGAAALLRAASAVLYGTSIADVRLYALAAAVVLACSAVAFVLPARRAAAADPSAILRSE
jgi:ABC-type antimicrobial peptide transport system permease subunit